MQELWTSMFLPAMTGCELGFRKKAELAVAGFGLCCPLPVSPQGIPFCPIAIIVTC